MLNWIVKIDFLFFLFYFYSSDLAIIRNFLHDHTNEKQQNGNYFVLSNINNFHNNTSINNTCINITELQIVLYEPKRMWSKHIEPTHLMVHVMCYLQCYIIMFNAILWCSVHIIYVNWFFCLIINHFSFRYQRTIEMNWIDVDAKNTKKWINSS